MAVHRFAPVWHLLHRHVGDHRWRHLESGELPRVGTPAKMQLKGKPAGTDQSFVGRRRDGHEPLEDEDEDDVDAAEGQA